MLPPALKSSLTYLGISAGIGAVTGGIAANITGGSWIGGAAAGGVMGGVMGGIGGWKAGARAAAKGIKSTGGGGAFGAFLGGIGGMLKGDFAGGWGRMGKYISGREGVQAREQAIFKDIAKAVNAKNPLPVGMQRSIGRGHYAERGVFESLGMPIPPIVKGARVGQVSQAFAEHQIKTERFGRGASLVGLGLGTLIGANALTGGFGSTLLTAGGAIGGYHLARSGMGGGKFLGGIGALAGAGLGNYIGGGRLNQLISGPSGGYGPARGYGY